LGNGSNKFGDHCLNTFSRVGQSIEVLSRFVAKVQRCKWLLPAYCPVTFEEVLSWSLFNCFRCRAETECDEKTDSSLETKKEMEGSGSDSGNTPSSTDVTNVTESGKTNGTLPCARISSMSCPN